MSRKSWHQKSIFEVYGTVLLLLFRSLSWLDSSLCLIMFFSIRKAY
ncbi:hypothetical protein AI2999V1_0271 [Enterobacter cloacae]|nr:hypothetical protein AI2999V1_0271 [Enterobacter cloacae]CAH5444457.1 hypothetical protein AI2999V1_0271 [Enterobacter cloacae]